MLSENTNKIAIIGSGFLGLTLALRLAETGAVCKCGQFFHKFSTEDAEEFDAECSSCGLEYEIKNLVVTEK